MATTAARLAWWMGLVPPLCSFADGAETVDSAEDDDRREVREGQILRPTGLRRLVEDI